MVSVCTVPARGGRSCEHFGGYKTINRIPLPFHVCLYNIHCPAYSRAFSHQYITVIEPFYTFISEYVGVGSETT